MSRRKFKIQPYQMILAALVLGIVAGIFLPKGSGWVSWIGDMFMNALSMLIVPIIFFSIIKGISGICLSDPSSLKKLGGKTIGLYVLTMSIAIALGLLLVFLINPGKGVDVSLADAASASNVQKKSVAEIVTAFVPSNFMYALAHNSTIPIILVSALIGVCVTKISDPGRSSLMNFFDGAYDLTMEITRLVLKLAPLGIFAICYKQFSQVSDVLSLFAGMAKYLLTVTLGLLIHTFVFLPILMRLGFKISPLKHLKNMSEPLMTAFATASSGAALPMTLEAVKEKDKVSAKVADFVIPLGSTINMNGAALLECVAVVFIAQAYGVQLDVVQTILISVTALLCAIGSAGIPMSAMVMMTLILTVVGLPIEGIGLVIGVDRILDMMRTAVNVYGDTCVAAMVAKSEGEVLDVDIRK